MGTKTQHIFKATSTVLPNALTQIGSRTADIEAVDRRPRNPVMALVIQKIDPDRVPRGALTQWIPSWIRKLPAERIPKSIDARPAEISLFSKGSSRVDSNPKVIGSSTRDC